MTPETTELRELRVLQAFKERLPRAELGENVSPFDDRVVTCNDPVARFDLSDIHADVRRRIENVIGGVHDRQKSQVILLSGERGTGKTHLLQTFRSHDRAAEHGYVFVGGSNHWAVEEFQARLLDWVVEALTAPSPSADHLLLERVRAIGFRALDHLLESAAWRQYVARPPVGWLGRRLRSLALRFGIETGPSHDRLEALAARRDPSVFGMLDFAKFSEYVCDRFLADKSNPTHRYALRVLLTYLFPPAVNTGVGYRERVLHWFRRRSDDGYFRDRLGVDEPLDRKFALFEAVKLLVHLFSPAVSRELNTEKHRCPPRVFLMTFDQVEAPNELFESDDDWSAFFAQLSELYNTLPNAVVVFTMTLGLRNRLHTLMERQFMDRIRMDESYRLGFPTEAQILGLYRSRVEHWLRDDPILLDLYGGVENRCLPLTRASVAALADRHSMRDVLENLDREFRRQLTEAVPIEPRLDFLVAFNEEHRNYRCGRDRTDDVLQYDLSFTNSHLQTLRALLQAVGGVLVESQGVRIVGAEVDEGVNPPVLSIEFQDTNKSGLGVWVHVVRFGFYFNDPAQKSIENSIRGKERLKHFLWMVRAAEFSVEPPDRYKDRVVQRCFPPELDSRLRALLLVANNRPTYERPPGHWPVALDLIRQELGPTYVGELIRFARHRLDAILNKPEPSEPTDEEEATTPAGPASN